MSYCDKCHALFSSKFLSPEDMEALSSCCLNSVFSQKVQSKSPDRVEAPSSPEWLHEHTDTSSRSESPEWQEESRPKNQKRKFAEPPKRKQQRPRKRRRKCKEMGIARKSPEMDDPAFACIEIETDSSDSEVYTTMQQSTRMQDREESAVHVFTVKGCDVPEFNGNYFVDIAHNNGFQNGKRCYRKNGVGNAGSECTIYYASFPSVGGVWTITKNYGNLGYYEIYSNSEQPPKTGWSAMSGSGSLPRLVFKKRSKRVQNRKESSVPAFTVKGCDRTEFNGKYFVDISHNNGFRNGRRCYCKNGVGKNGSECKVWYFSTGDYGLWMMTKSYGYDSYYQILSKAEQPPKAGWVVIKGSGTPPKLVFAKPKKKATGRRPCKKVPGWHGVFSRSALDGSKKYFTLVSIRGKKVYRGTFETEKECAIAYDDLVVKERGLRKAKLNFRERYAHYLDGSNRYPR